MKFSGLTIVAPRGPSSRATSEPGEAATGNERSAARSPVHPGTFAVPFER